MLWGTDWPHPTVTTEPKPNDAAILDKLALWAPDPALRQRILVDVGDVSRLIHHLVEHDISPNSTQSLASAHSVHVADVLNAIGELLDVEPIFGVVDAGESYDISTDFVNRHFGSDDPLMKRDYWRAVLQKHVPAIAAKIRSTT